MKTTRPVLCAVAVLLLSVCTVAAADGVRVSIEPDTTFTMPDSTFKVYVYADSAGSPFNTYRTVIRWDPRFIEFVSVQSESLFNQHNFILWLDPGSPAPDSVGYLHSLMEGGASETGPGALSSLTFRALRNGQSPILFSSIEFYLFGSYVNPVISSDGRAIVGAPAAFEGEQRIPLPQTRFVRVVPNPITADSEVLLAAVGSRRGRLCLYNPVGALLREVDIPTGIPGNGSSVRCPLSWLLSDAGRSSGVYLIRFRTDQGDVSGRFVYVK
jgi:hypothetical protein